MKSALAIAAALALACGVKGPPRPPQAKPPTAAEERPRAGASCEACGAEERTAPPSPPAPRTTATSPVTP